MDEVQVMTRRPTTTDKMKLAVLKKCGATVRCHCGLPNCEEVVPVTEVEYNHDPPWELLHEHSVEVLFPVSKEHHKILTHGAKHAFHTSDRGKINKVKRQEAARLALERGEEKAKKHRPIQSRGFDKTLRKKLDGTVEERK